MMYSTTMNSIHVHGAGVQPKFQTLESSWSPVLNLMKAFGLYHYSDKGTWWLNAWKFYSGVVLFFVFSMLAMHLVTLPSATAGNDSYSAYQFDCILNILWHAGLLGYAVSLFMTSHQPTKLRAFYHKWMELDQVTNICQVQRTIRRQAMFIAGSLCIVMLLCCIEIAVYRSFLGLSFYLVAAALVLQCIELVTLGFYLLVFITLTSVINHANSIFLKFLKNPMNSPRSSFERCRSTYVLLFDLVDIADNVLSFPIGCCIFCSLSILTLLSFTYVLYAYDDQSTLLNFFDCIFWIILLVILLFFLLWRASAVNHEIHSVYPHLSKLKIGDFPLPMQNELLFLQNWLGSSTIGISAFKMHLITRGFSSSIVSAYLSYLIILLQFRDSKCNGKDL